MEACVSLSPLKQRRPRQLDQTLRREESCPQSNNIHLSFPRASGTVAKAVICAFKIPASGTAFILSELKDSFVVKIKVHFIQMLLVFPVTAMESGFIRLK